jgi:L-amino acid N-acyltransferase YncA
MNMLRPAQESDLPEILAIYNDAILNTTAVYHYEAHTLEDRMKWFIEKQTGGYPVVVWQEEGRIAGFATYGPFRPWPAYKYTVEHSVYVHRGFRGRGAGEKLLREIIRLAEAKSLATMVAGIDASNEVSIALHHKLGFTMAGTIHRAGFKFGRWLDLAFYQLELSGPLDPRDG